MLTKAASIFFLDNQTGRFHARVLFDIASTCVCLCSFNKKQGVSQ